MSASRNTKSLASQGGEFHARIAPSEPLTTKGHKPGVKVGNDAVPDYHAEIFPVGTAPQEHIYHPQPQGEFPTQTMNSESSVYTDPLDALGGSTSQQVHTGLGKPMQGQEGRELHGVHDRKRKKEGTGIAGVGASAGSDHVRAMGADLPEGASKGSRGKATADYPSAEDRVPETAERVAAENSGPKGRTYDYSANERY